MLDLLLRGGLAHPEVNVPLVLAGRRVIPDFRWPAGARVLRITWDQAVARPRQTLSRVRAAGAPRAPQSTP